ncbi:hypothetical protein FISHEDRAFT_37900, partial [Fistulina hepatica ATCC 64428]
YCEENIYLAIQSLLKSSLNWDVYAVFISNHNKTVALWKQKLAKTEEDLVIWDYHVIAIVHQPQARTCNYTGDIFNTWAYDFDSQIDMPCRLQDYLAQTFSADIPQDYQSLFRVIPGQVFLDEFATDRSHMVDSESRGDPVGYRMPPPPFPAPVGRRAVEKGISNNFMSAFVSMGSLNETYGKVFSLQEMFEGMFL